MGWKKSKVINQKSELQFKNHKFLVTGFSLVELMIVIAIIGIVSAVGVTSISSIQSSSRNAQRTSDLSTLKVALQRFYADKQYYPNTLDLAANGALTNCTGDTGCTVTKVYLNRTPSDPITGTTTPYRYCAQKSSTITTDCSVSPGTCHYYTLCATMENPASTTSCTCASPATGNYKVNPL